MSSLDEPFLPTAKRHSTLFSSSTRYHKLLVLALIALLALTVAPANAADIPPQCRQYKCTRSLVYETVKREREREPPARPDQAFGIPSLEKRGPLDKPSESDKHNISASNWRKYFSNVTNFIKWWMENFKTDPFNSNGNGNGNGNGNSNGNGNGNADKKTTSTTTPARTTAILAATTRAQSTTNAQATTRSTTSALSSPAPISPASSNNASGTSVTLQTTPTASGSNSVPNGNTGNMSKASGGGFDDDNADGSNIPTNGSSSKTDITGMSPSSMATESGPIDQGAETANSDPDRKWVIGLVIGLLLFLFTCCGLGYILVRKRRAREREREQTSSTSSEVFIAEKGQEPGMVHSLSSPTMFPSPPPVTYAALPPAVPVAAVAPADNRRDSRRVSRMSMVNTRPTTPSSYLSSEFSEKSLFQYEPDPSIGVPVDYPIAIHVPPRVAKALAKRDAARLANEQLELAESERAMYLQPGPSRVTHASEGSSGTRNTDGHGSYFGLPPTGYQTTGEAESSNAHSIGHGAYSDLNRWSAASSRLSGSIPVHEAFPLPPEPISTPRSAVFRLGSMAAIVSVLPSDPSVDRPQWRVSQPLPPIPQQEDDPFRDDVAHASPMPLHNPFIARRASQGSLITDESTNTGGGSSQETHIVGAVTATATVTPAARVVYSTVNTSSDVTILAYNRSSDASMTPATAAQPNTGPNPFGDEHGFPMRSQVAYTGVVMTNAGEAIDEQATEQHDESQSVYQRSTTPALSTPQTPSTPSTAHTFGR